MSKNAEEEQERERNDTFAGSVTEWQHLMWKHHNHWGGREEWARMKAKKEVAVGCKAQKARRKKKERTSKVRQMEKKEERTEQRQRTLKKGTREEKKQTQRGTACAREKEESRRKKYKRREKKSEERMKKVKRKREMAEKKREDQTRSADELLLLLMLGVIMITIRKESSWVALKADVGCYSTVSSSTETRE